jgi:hypothetical protein
MRTSTRCFLAILTIGVALMTPIKMAFASLESTESSDLKPFNQLTAEWWQWALSIPTKVNPLLDTNGGNCMIGQRGSMWFLAGTFGIDMVTRTCDVPEGKALFFPVINQINFNTPGVCGQSQKNLTVKDMRALSAAFVVGQPNYR